MNANLNPLDLSRYFHQGEWKLGDCPDFDLRMSRTLLLIDKHLNKLLMDQYGESGHL